MTTTYRNPDGSICPGGEECTGACLADPDDHDCRGEFPCYDDPDCKYAPLDCCGRRVGYCICP